MPMNEELSDLIKKMEAEGHDFEKEPVLFRWFDKEGYFYELLISRGNHLEDDEDVTVEDSTILH